MRGEKSNKELFDKHIAAMGLKLDVYEKIMSKQKYAACGNVCVLHNYVNMNIYLCNYLFLLGYYFSRPVPCRCEGSACKNGKRRDGIGVATKCQEVR